MFKEVAYGELDLPERQLLHPPRPHIRHAHRDGKDTAGRAWQLPGVSTHRLHWAGWEGVHLGSLYQYTLRLFKQSRNLSVNMSR